jgi:SAM-dependent methyltransferase
MIAVLLFLPGLCVMEKMSLLRKTFDAVASDYAAIRPSYPDALIEQVITFAGLQPASRCLEIGCGTGQATLPFARYGCEIVCLDIGAELLAHARQYLQAYPRITFQQISFEEWPPEPEAFDLVFSATAFHWVPPEIGYPKTGQVLRAGGTLALFWTTHPPEKEGFFSEMDEIYRRFDPGWVEPQKRKTHLGDESQIRAYYASAGVFGPVELLRFPAPREYTAAEYVQLVNTFSDTRAMPEYNRQGLLDGLAGMIDQKYGGKVVKHTVFDLYLAQKQVS